MRICSLITNHSYIQESIWRQTERQGWRKEDQAGVRFKKNTGYKEGWRVEVLGNQAMSQSRCARTFGFPVGEKKKNSMSESRMQSGGFVLQRLLWQRFPSSPFRWKGGRKNFPCTPFLAASMWPRLIRFCELEVGGRGSSLKRLPHHQKNGECKGANWLAPKSGEKHFT